MTLYDVLQVAAHADTAVIEAAYRALARTYHPDVCAHGDAARRMARVNDAYAVLRDPHARANYDLALRGHRVRPTHTGHAAKGPGLRSRVLRVHAA